MKHRQLHIPHSPESSKGIVFRNGRVTPVGRVVTAAMLAVTVAAGTNACSPDQGSHARTDSTTNYFNLDDDKRAAYGKYAKEAAARDAEKKITTTTTEAPSLSFIGNHAWQRNAENTPDGGDYWSYTVVEGDNPWDIAGRQATIVDEIGTPVTNEKLEIIVDEEERLHVINRIVVQMDGQATLLPGAVLDLAPHGDPILDNPTIYDNRTDIFRIEIAPMD